MLSRNDLKLRIATIVSLYNMSKIDLILTFYGALNVLVEIQYILKMARRYNFFNRLLRWLLLSPRSLYVSGRWLARVKGSLSFQHGYARNLQRLCCVFLLNLASFFDSNAEEKYRVQ